MGIYSTSINLTSRTHFYATYMGSNDFYIILNSKEKRFPVFCSKTPIKSRFPQSAELLPELYPARQFVFFRLFDRVNTTCLLFFE